MGLTIYKIQLSMFGTIAVRADVEIEAKSEKEAEKIALEDCHDGNVDFSNDQECVDGWDYQVEDCEEID